MGKGSFTLPGEAGYEKLTLELAEKWGADVIRDSDGTVLSDEITNAGYGIYSTICIIRDHNEWAKQNEDKLQQSFLMTYPKVAENDFISISLMEDFFEEQFRVNTSADSLNLIQSLGVFQPIILQGIGVFQLLPRTASVRTVEYR